MKRTTFSCAVLLLIFLLSPALPQVILPTSQYPPLISDVSFYPEEPIEKQDVRVTAKVYNQDEKTQDSVVSVYLNFSKNNGTTWEEIEMEQSKQDEKLWHATIQGEMEMMEVLFYVRAEDTGGNITTESPGNARAKDEKSWIPDDNSLALIVKDEDESSSAAPDELDLLKISAGTDDKFFYLKFEAQGKFPNETATTNNFFPELAFSLSSIKDQDYWVRHYGTHYGYYSPALSNLGALYPCAVGRFGADGIIHRDEFKKVDYIVKENVLYMKIQKELVITNPEDGLKMLFLTALQPISFSEDGTLYDVTAFSNMYLRNHAIKYKSGSIIKPALDNIQEK